MPRFYVSEPLHPGSETDLPETVARHVQVLRLQPGAVVTLFDGDGGECSAEVLEMGRRHVSVRVGARVVVEREASRAVHLVVGLMASERMDWLVEKATELGVVRITPVLAERSMLKLSGERAAKKRDHWHAAAISACEQSGRNRIPLIDAPQALATALASVDSSQRWVLGFSSDAQAASWAPTDSSVAVLSGPEGGLSPGEEAQARAANFQTVTLGPRTLRAETAPLAALSWLTLR